MRCSKLSQNGEEGRSPIGPLCTRPGCLGLSSKGYSLPSPGAQSGFALLSVVLLSAFLLGFGVIGMRMFWQAYGPLKAQMRTLDADRSFLEDSLRSRALGGIAKTHRLVAAKGRGLLVAEGYQPRWSEFEHFAQPCSRWNEGLPDSRIISRYSCERLDEVRPKTFVPGNLELDGGLTLNQSVTLAVAGSLKLASIRCRECQGAKIVIVALGDIDIDQIVYQGELVVHSVLGKVRLSSGRLGVAIRLSGLAGVEINGHAVGPVYGSLESVFLNRQFLGMPSL